MKITIKATKMPLTTPLKEYCQAKMDKLEKYLGKVKALHCDLELEKTPGDQRSGDIFRAEVNLQVPSELIRVERSAKDLYKAIDKAQEHLKLVIKKHKEKRLDGRKRASA